MSRVTSITQDGTEIVIKYSDCTETRIDLCVDCDEPVSDNPGDWPDPIPGTGDARCRIAVKVGYTAAEERLDDFLSGLNLNVGTFNILGAYIANRISVYGWPISVYSPLLYFAQSLYDSAGFAGRGLAAKTEYDADPTTAQNETHEALYCAIDNSGRFNESNRELWISELATRSGAFYAVLRDFVRVWPLDDLRQKVFNASTTTDAVDCSAFDCEGMSPEDCGDRVNAAWQAFPSDDFEFIPVSGTTAQFPGYALKQYTNMPISSTRTTRGWESPNVINGQIPTAVAVQRIFSTPLTLCSLFVDAALYDFGAPSLAGNNRNTRRVSAYVKLVGQAGWSFVGTFIRVINEPGRVQINWIGLLQIDAIAIVGAGGAKYMTLIQCDINPPSPV